MPVSQYCYETQVRKDNYETVAINIKVLSHSEILWFYVKWQKACQHYLF